MLFNLKKIIQVTTIRFDIKNEIFQAVRVV